MHPHVHTQTKFSPTKEKTFSGAREQLCHGIWKGNKNTSEFHYEFSFILTAKTVSIYHSIQIITHNCTKYSFFSQFT